MCVILPLFYCGAHVVVQHITTSIKEINIAIYHTNVLAIYQRQSIDINVLFGDCPPNYLASQDRTEQRFAQWFARKQSR